MPGRYMKIKTLIPFEIGAHETIDDNKLWAEI